MEGDLEHGRAAAMSCSFASDEESSDALVRKNSMRYRKTNASIVQETETDGKAWKQSTSTGDPEIVVGESEESSSGSTIVISTSMESGIVRHSIESPLKAKFEPSVYYDKVQGVWKCHHCSWVCPVLKSGVEFIYSHKEHCQGMNNTRALVGQGFPIKHEIQECSRANLYLVKEGGEIESENTDLLEDKTMPKVLEKKTIIKADENQKWSHIEDDWQSNHMALEASTEAYISQSFTTGEDKRELQTEMGTNAFQDYTKKELISCTSSQNRATATRENTGTITNGGQGAPENVGIQQHQHGNNLSESVMQNSQNAFMREQDETQLRNHWTRTLENCISTGNVEEEIVRVLKEQQSHDLLCPVCGSCITKRVILRKRKRTSPVFVYKRHRETKGDALAVASDGGLAQRGEDQNDQPETQNNDTEENEAYGCLSCFSLFRKVTGVQYLSTKLESWKGGLATQSSSKMSQDDKEKESIHCLLFLYPWNIKKEPDSGPESVSVVKISQMESEQEVEVSASNVENGDDLGGTITKAGTVSTGTAIHNTIQQTNVIRKASITLSGNKSVLEVAEDKILSAADRADVIHGVGENWIADSGASNQLNYAYSPGKHDGPESVSVVKIPQMESEQEVEVSASNVEICDDLGGTITEAGTVSMGTAIHNMIQQTNVVSKASITITGNKSVLEVAEDKILSEADRADVIHGVGESSIADCGAGNQLNYAYSPGKHNGPESVSVVKIPQMEIEQEAEVSVSNVENGDDLGGTITEAGMVSTGAAIHTTIQRTDVVSKASSTITGNNSVLEVTEDKILSAADRADVLYGVGENSIADSGASNQLNYAYSPGKHDDAVEESNRFPHEAKSNPGITPHIVNYESSDISNTGATITSSRENMGGTGTRYISTEATNATQHLVKLDAPSQPNKQHSDQQVVERKEEKLPKRPVTGIANLDIKQAEQLTARAFSEYSSPGELDMVRSEIETKIQEEEIQKDTAAKLDEPNNGSYFCSCIPVSIQSIWSAWPSKEIIKGGQLNEPFLNKDASEESADKGLSIVEKTSSNRGMLQSYEHYRGSQSADANRIEKKLLVQPGPVESSSTSEEQDRSLLAESKGECLVSHTPPISPCPEETMNTTHMAVSDSSTIIDVQSGEVRTESVVDHVPPEPPIVGSAQWDILKSIVYGGLNVSLTSFGVVSSAAGGEAKTLTVIAIGLANMVAGLFMLFNNIVELQDERTATIGPNLWFNGFVAVFSYLIFGSLAPITYGFSFQEGDNRNYKFFTTCGVCLVSILLLALGKARVTEPQVTESRVIVRHYVKTVSLYVMGGFWVSVIGYLSGEYINKLLEKWGFKTDNANTQNIYPWSSE